MFVLIKTCEQAPFASVSRRNAMGLGKFTNLRDGCCSFERELNMISNFGKLFELFF